MSQPELTTNFLIKDNILNIEYSVFNKLEQEIYVQNIFKKYSEDGRLQWDTNIALIKMVSDKIIHISKSTFRIPHFMGVESPSIPSLTKISSGEIFREKLTLPLPLTEFNPYVEEDDLDSAPVFSRGIVFSIGFLTNQKDLQIQKNETNNFYYSDYSFLLNNQELLSSEIFPASIPYYKDMIHSKNLVF